MWLYNTDTSTFVPDFQPYLEDMHSWDQFRFSWHCTSIDNHCSTKRSTVGKSICTHVSTYLYLHSYANLQRPLNCYLAVLGPANHWGLNPIPILSKWDFVLENMGFPSSLFYIEWKMWTQRFNCPYQRQNESIWRLLKRSARRM